MPDTLSERIRPLIEAFETNGPVDYHLTTSRLGWLSDHPHLASAELRPALHLWSIASMDDIWSWWRDWSNAPEPRRLRASLTCNLPER